MTFDSLAYLTAWFIGLFIAGTILCLWQAGWDHQKFFRSSLWVKIVFWIPIYTVFIAVIYLGPWSMVAVWGLIAAVAIREWSRVRRHSWLSRSYFVSFILLCLLASCFHAIAGTMAAAELLIIICFCSVLSDVFAYFFGTLLGRHHLPAALNPNKSWEGVAGQLIGSFAGALVIWPVVSEPRLLLFALVIGIASAVGDLFNSAAKRQVGIKDWGQSIPGHGGVMDRFSSLSLALVAAGFLSTL
jgi:phosphatidate cytidylyltransferase